MYQVVFSRCAYLDSDGAANSLAGADGPELLEGLGTVDGRLVVAGSLEDVVGAAVRLDLTLLLSSRSRVVGAVSLNNVVLDKGVAGPSVERDVRVDILGVPGTAVGDYTGGSRVPEAMLDVLLRNRISDSAYHPLPATKLPTLLHWTS